MTRDKNRAPIIATLGALAAVIASLAAVWIVAGNSVIFGGLGIGLAAILIVIVGILIGLKTHDNKSQ